MSKEIFFKDSTIRQYVNGDLEGQLLSDFEQELKINEDLKTEAELAAFLVANYNLEQKRRFKTLMPADTVIEMPKESNTGLVSGNSGDGTVRKMTPSWIKYAAAAMIFLALGVGLFMMNNQTINSPQLAQTYLENPYAAPIVSRGDNTEEVWNDAVLAYKKEDYDQSLTLINKMVDKGEAKEVHLFYLGLNQLYKNNPDPQNAILQFQEIKSGYYFDSAKWYESLAYLKLDNKEKAMVVLGQIKESSRAKEVNDLLEKLK